MNALKLIRRQYGLLSQQRSFFSATQKTIDALNVYNRMVSDKEIRSDPVQIKALS